MTDFEIIYMEHFDNVYGYVLSLCRDETIAEEVTQEAFYRAMEHLEQFEGKCSLYVWLCQIAKHTYFESLRKQKRHLAKMERKAMQQEEHRQEEENFEKTLLDKETTWKLHVLLHQLKDPYKEVFSLRVFGELPFAQIGELFGKTDSWARLIFYRAKNELRRKLDERDM